MSDTELRTILASNVESVRQRIASACARAGRLADSVTLVAVTKSVSESIAHLLPELGILDLGENRPQGLWQKAEALKQAPVRWHMIGHLQRNKVGRTLPLTHLIHGVDSFRLLHEIAAEGNKLGFRPRVLFQVNASREEQKHGFDFDALLEAAHELTTTTVDVLGLMCMAAYCDNPENARPTFAALREFRDRLKSETGLSLYHLSMGMSGDFEVAIEEGATLVRVGTTLFEGLAS